MQQASGTAKIDPLMAAFNAIAWMAANPASSQPSIFVIYAFPCGQRFTADGGQCWQKLGGI
jgi:hypothetical protein